MPKQKSKLSIIIPAYNEEKTISQILNELKKTKFPIRKEILIIDDFSKDKTKKNVSSYVKKNHNTKLFSHKRNLGKGAAIKTGIKNASGNIIAIQDADLEYSPADLSNLVTALLEGNLPVVYGSRFLGGKKKGKTSFYLGNKFLSFITSILFLTKITDMETCYKVFRKELLKDIKIESNSFNFEPEITSKLLKKGYKIKEMPIKYNPRTKEQGKKIKIKDGLIALRCLIKYRFSN
ncbi:MAG: glycosyltransferase family 2 protein [Nanoarchaeota archaeon]